MRRVKKEVGYICCIVGIIGDSRTSAVFLYVPDYLSFYGRHGNGVIGCNVVSCRTFGLCFENSVFFSLYRDVAQHGIPYP